MTFHENKPVSHPQQVGSGTALPSKGKPLPLNRLEQPPEGTNWCINRVLHPSVQIGSTPRGSATGADTHGPGCSRRGWGGPLSCTGRRVGPGKGKGVAGRPGLQCGAGGGQRGGRLTAPHSPLERKPHSNGDHCVQTTAHERTQAHERTARKLLVPEHESQQCRTVGFPFGIAGQG